jgi:hypothetical protein
MAGSSRRRIGHHPFISLASLELDRVGRLPPWDCQGNGCFYVRQPAWAAKDDWVKLAGDIALEAAHDLSCAQALGGPSFDVSKGAWIAAHAGQCDGVQGRVGLSVTAPVESMPVRFARRGRDRADPAERREAGLVAESVGNCHRPR